MPSARVKPWLWTLLGVLALLAALIALPRLQAAQAERQRQAQEAARLAAAERLLNSDPVKFQVYVKQVAIAAEVIGQGMQDASGPCVNLSGFENGLGDPPPEAKSCQVSDPGEGHATVRLVLKDGRVFTWPE